MRPTPNRVPARSSTDVNGVCAAIRNGSDLFGEVTARSRVSPWTCNCNNASTAMFAISPSPARIAATADGVCCTRTSSTSTPSSAK